MAKIVIKTFKIQTNIGKNVTKQQWLLTSLQNNT